MNQQTEVKKSKETMQALTLRLPKIVVARLKEIAASEGLTTGALIRSILHKYAESKLEK